ncbi:MAG: Bax inhibitor-1 family protein, partial [Prevotella sp.]|nr:Bax inhibitor-1 family protein [Prevotella sp.]
MDYSNFGVENASRDRELYLSAAFPALMRKVYLWMAMALVITGFTAYGVATSPAAISAILTNRMLFWGLLIAEFGLVIWLTAAINRLSLSVATL